MPGWGVSSLPDGKHLEASEADQTNPQTIQLNSPQLLSHTLLHFSEILPAGVYSHRIMVMNKYAGMK